MNTTQRTSGKGIHAGLLILMLWGLSACSTNPATGESQFTALMSPQQEVQIGAQEHEKIIKQFGAYPDPALTSYVQQVGETVARNTERPDVQYKFFLLDSPVVNAFALPGGYIYITRGLMALANSEAEMASVLAHETGHITARHSAERYSRGVVTSLGAAILASAVGSAGVSEALGVGSDLYVKSYSRGQESQADDLGIRYLSRAGYDPMAMASFLQNLQGDTELEAQIMGKKSSSSTDYFSTHPATAQRVNDAAAGAYQYGSGGMVNDEVYLKRLNGMIYGDSADQGIIRGRSFYHPDIGFAFTVPEGFKIINQPTQVIATSQSNGVLIFDMTLNKEGISPTMFLKDVWMKGEALSGEQSIDINGLQAATASFNGTVNGKPMIIRLVVIQWTLDRFARFQIAIPHNAGQGLVEDLKRATYSFHAMSEQEKQEVRPHRLQIVQAKAGDTVASMSQLMPFDDFREERFRVLNGLKPGEGIQTGSLYKLVVE